ncbi:MAG TPA: divalent-cation tolerance protein CutA [Nitrospiraceae bacterium]|nr:divalent-cation tolerance protein CutA [Nitrospiraceae bacterium]
MTGTNLVVLVSAGSVEEATSIARRVVEERLAACASVIEHMQSIFRWEGQIKSEPESLIILKTTGTRFAELQARIKALHSYSVPEIIALPIVIGADEYLAWLEKETQK